MTQRILLATTVKWPSSATLAGAFAAFGWMPEVRVTDANEQVNDEEGYEDTFDHQEIFAFRFPFFDQFITLQMTENCSHDKYAAKDDCNGRARVWNSERAANP